jgi:3-deoxy-D-manno-octulosonic-acid transferase
MYLVYSALLALFLILTLPYWILQMMRHGKYRAGLRERMGGVRQDLRGSSKPAMWIHAVSVGEVVASSGVIAQLQEKFPSHRVLISTTTNTGQKLAAKRFGEENVFYFPLDFAFAIRPWMRALNPDMIILAETEFWPNFLRIAGGIGCRVAVINGRISDRSLAGYRRLHFWMPAVLSPVDLFLAQTEEDGRRLIAVGAPEKKVQVTGNLKFDVAPPPSPPIVESLRQNLRESGGGPLLVCGSTVEDEEGSLLSAFRNILANHPRAVMVLAPRHPERFAAVAEQVEQLGFRMWKRSLWSGEPVIGGVFLLDTIGELMALYSIATVAFVGGSLVPRGGHNILEPALYGVPIVTGNHYDNFRDIVEYFLWRKAVRVVGLAELPLTFIELIEHPEEREALGRNALAALEAQRGATERTVSALMELMNRPKRDQARGSA